MSIEPRRSHDGPSARPGLSRGLPGRLVRLPRSVLDRLARIETKLDALTRQVDEVTDSRAADLRRIDARIERELRPLLLALVRDDAGNRRRLFELRAEPEYELAYTDPDPGVTIAIVTAPGRSELLLGRALPSALAQTHANLDIVIVGDAIGADATAELGAALDRIGDGRVRLADITQRFVHADPDRHWLSASVIARNEAHRLANGRWIVDLDDDDALRPAAVADLLRLAREHRLEVAYGLMQRCDPDGERTLIGAFPPAPTEPDWRARGLPYQPWEGAASCGAVVHAGLRFFAREHAATDVPAPGDFFRLERMVRAGVRFGMLPEVVYDYYPSLLWQPDERNGGGPS